MQDWHVSTSVSWSHWLITYKSRLQRVEPPRGRFPCVADITEPEHWRAWDLETTCSDLTHMKIPLMLCFSSHEHRAPLLGTGMCACVPTSVQDGLGPAFMELMF